MNWIKDRKPENERRVLVKFKPRGLYKTQYATAMWDYNQDCWFFYDPVQDD